VGLEAKAALVQARHEARYAPTNGPAVPDWAPEPMKRTLKEVR
jgi:hypothetical protein